MYEARQVPGLPYVSVYACVYGGHRSYKLGIPPPPPRSLGAPSGREFIQNEVLSGPIVAYERRTVPATAVVTDVLYVRDLRSGRVLHVAPTGAPVPGEPASAGNGEAVTVVAKADGAIAWIVETAIAPNKYEVRAVDESGTRVLAAGNNIDPSSLALAGSTLYWTQGGEPLAATLH